MIRNLSLIARPGALTATHLLLQEAVGRHMEHSSYFVLGPNVFVRLGLGMMIGGIAFPILNLGSAHDPDYRETTVPGIMDHFASAGAGLLCFSLVWDFIAIAIRGSGEWPVMPIGAILAGLIAPRVSSFVMKGIQDPKENELGVLGFRCQNAVHTSAGIFLLGALMIFSEIYIKK